MPSAKKDRVTISLHLDKRIYALLKRCSEIEKQPMSRIVDHHLGKHVEKYAYETLEESNDAEPYRLEELEHQEEIDLMTYEPTREDKLTGFANTLGLIETQKDAPKEAIEQIKKYILEQVDDSEMTRITEIQKNQKAESDRWKEAAKKYPLP